MPGKRGADYLERRPYEGPVQWLFPRLEETYTRLGPKDEVEPALQQPGSTPPVTEMGLAVAAAAERIPHEERLVEGRVTSVPRDYWADVLAAYHRRRVATETPALAAIDVVPPGLPAIPGQNNWTPLGPGVTGRGQTANRAAVAGRVSGIAIAPAGSRIYAATANGGVWRSDDGGFSWRSTMDGFDINPTNFATTSLACGAIAIDPANPDRVYVGTGEGDTDALFAQRIVNALPAYRGIGPSAATTGA